MGIAPENTMFIVLSFEGTDVYSMAGGLSSKIAYLTNTLMALVLLRIAGNFYVGDAHREHLVMEAQQCLKYGL